MSYIIISSAGLPAGPHMNKHGLQGKHILMSPLISRIAKKDFTFLAISDEFYFHPAVKRICGDVQKKFNWQMASLAIGESLPIIIGSKKCQVQLN